MISREFDYDNERSEQVRDSSQMSKQSSLIHRMYTQLPSILNFDTSQQTMDNNGNPINVQESTIEEGIRRAQNSELDKMSSKINRIQNPSLVHMASFGNDITDFFNKTQTFKDSTERKHTNNHVDQMSMEMLIESQSFHEEKAPTQIINKSSLLKSTESQGIEEKISTMMADFVKPINEDSKL